MSTRTQKLLRRLFGLLARRVEKNQLFEQPNERAIQPPLQLEKVEPENESVSFATSEVIAKEIHSSSGYLLVHHWATWCDGCMEELDDIQNFVASIQDKKVGVYGVSWELFNGTPPQHGIPVVRHVHQAHSLSFQSKIVQGAPEALFEDLQLKEEQIPQTAVYKDGACIFSHMGILGESERKQIIRHVEEPL
jgi:thiol-disulfide isomerase/thioredoxin